MTVVFLGLGSNVKPHIHLPQAIAALENQFGELTLSPVYQNPAVGFEGADFWNAVVYFQTNQCLAALCAQIKQLELSLGRAHQLPKYAPRVIDIDVLFYGDYVDGKRQYDIPRREITQFAFVLKPLLDIAPDFIHPVEKETIATLWARLPISNQPLQHIEMAPLSVEPVTS